MMRRAIALASGRLGQTGDNPAVGCVIATGTRVFAEAATEAGGRPHAEEQALSRAAGLANGATAYVTLEPCAERSNGAPSCAERLVRAGVARVAFGLANPHHLSAGRGPDRLRKAGVRVEGGLLEAEVAPLYRAFVARENAKGGASPRRPAKK
ncbi:MAG TPA: bifunctional diaminohydroxyphosphoribosylaminopyrimidine deaminase/5-amino-6-(5-phosphoribosylamino)uracil reductase RibD [Caulobacteraceae bacterium]